MPGGGDGQVPFSYSAPPLKSFTILIFRLSGEANVQGVRLFNGIESLDHPVIAARDLDAARVTFERLGFTVPPRGSHVEWGTGNLCIMFRGDYIEIQRAGCCRSYQARSPNGEIPSEEAREAMAVLAHRALDNLGRRFV